MRVLLCCALLGLLLGVLPGSAAFENVNDVDEKVPLEPGARWTHLARFEVGDRPSVVAIGNTGKSLLGLYVFDEHGNCVARDDQGMARILDDVAVEWAVTQPGHYCIEMDNLGSLPNGFAVAVRYQRGQKEKKS